MPLDAKANRQIELSYHPWSAWEPFDLPALSHRIIQ
jgi:hypothetical protein